MDAGPPLPEHVADKVEEHITAVGLIYRLKFKRAPQTRGGDAHGNRSVVRKAGLTENYFMMPCNTGPGNVNRFSTK